MVVFGVGCIADAGSGDDETEDLAAEGRVCGPAVPNDLASIVRGLLYVSETESKWTSRGFPLAGTDRSARPLTPSQFRNSIRRPSTAVSVEPRGLGLLDLQARQTPSDAKRYRALKSYLTTNLRTIQVFRVGAGVRFEIFVVGRTRCGELVGISTTAVET
jgi:hypothetical protein